MSETKIESQPSRGVRATVRTISTAAGVSASTVSRALAGDRRISEKTRLRVAEIAEQQGYTPNAIARGLVTRSSGVVGIVLGNMNNPFYGELIECLYRHLVAMGKAPMIIKIGGATLDLEAIQPIVQYQIDGCVIASATLSSTASEVCERQQMPMVMVNRVSRTQSCAVSCNNKGGGELIGSLLVEADHRKIAFIAGREDTSTSEDREDGLRAALKSAKLSLHAFGRGHYTYEGGYAAATEMLTAADRPDAIFAANDVMALGVLDAAHHLGICIPDELSVIGFDDIQMAGWESFSLTTVAQPLETMVSRCIDLLKQRIADPSLPGEQLFVHGELRVRKSARLPARLMASAPP